MYPATLAPLFGIIRLLREPQSCYRVHGRNDFAGAPAEERNRRNYELYYHRCLALSKHLGALGTEVAPDAWMKNYDPYYAWFERVCVALREIRAVVRPGESFILADDDQWGERLLVDGDILADRRRIHFMEKDGQYWGPPPDAETAIAELERHRAGGAVALAFAWPTFWWLDHYSGLSHYLRSKFPCFLENDRLVVFDLSAESGGHTGDCR
jgi:hypothetical protein